MRVEPVYASWSDIVMEPVKSSPLKRVLLRKKLLKKSEYSLVLRLK